MAVRTDGARSRGRMVSEINVTPFVDVMLVLLIIFMVAAPMMMQGIDVNLPVASSRPIPTETGSLVVSVTEDWKIHVNESEVELGMLGARLSAVRNGCGREKGVVLRADRKVEYGLVAQVMGSIREAGIGQISMVTEPPGGWAKHPASQR